MEIPRHSYDKVVVGSFVNALVYAFNEGIPLLNNCVKAPYDFEYFASGKSKLKLWQELSFNLSMLGLLPAADKIHSIRLDDNKLIAHSVNSKLLEFQCEKIVLYDDENVKGLPIPRKANNNREVVDYMHAKPCCRHSHKMLETEDKIVNKIFLYPKNYVKILSLLTTKQLEDFDYSGTYARFKALKVMKDAGIKGSRNGRNPKDQETVSYKKLRPHETREESV